MASSIVVVFGPFLFFAPSLSLTLSFFLTFARLADDGLRLGLGGEQALDAVCSGADLHEVRWVLFALAFSIDDD